eukprot:15324561-Ditylum_brightwellii.AAC.1
MTLKGGIQKGPQDSPEEANSSKHQRKTEDSKGYSVNCENAKSGHGIVRHTMACWYAHIFGHEHASQIFQLDGQVFTEYTCVHLREGGTDKATFGYVIKDVSEYKGIK